MATWLQTDRGIRAIYRNTLQEKIGTGYIHQLVFLNEHQEADNDPDATIYEWTVTIGDQRLGGAADSLDEACSAADAAAFAHM